MLAQQLQFTVSIDSISVPRSLMFFCLACSERTTTCLDFEFDLQSTNVAIGMEKKNRKTRKIRVQKADLLIELEKLHRMICSMLYLLHSKVARLPVQRETDPNPHHDCESLLYYCQIDITRPVAGREYSRQLSLPSRRVLILINATLHVE